MHGLLIQAVCAALQPSLQVPPVPASAHAFAHAPRVHAPIQQHSQVPAFVQEKLKASAVSRKRLIASWLKEFREKGRAAKRAHIYVCPIRPCSPCLRKLLIASFCCSASESPEHTIYCCWWNLYISVDVFFFFPSLASFLLGAAD